MQMGETFWKNSMLLYSPWKAVAWCFLIYLNVFLFLERLKPLTCIVYMYICSMVVTLDGNSEIGKREVAISVIWSVSGIWLDRERQQIAIFPQKIPIFLHACATCSDLPSTIRTMICSMGEMGSNRTIHFSIILLFFMSLCHFLVIFFIYCMPRK